MQARNSISSTAAGGGGDEERSDKTEGASMSGDTAILTFRICGNGVLRA